MRTKQFWIDLAERAGRTFAQVLAAAVLILPQPVPGAFDIRSLDWETSLSLAAGAALLSVLMSLGGTKRGDPESASLLSSAKQEQ